MKISIEDINKIIDECKLQGYDFVMSDLMYAILHPQFKDKTIIYYSLFGKGASETEISDYDISPKMSFLKKYVNKNILKKRTSTKDSIDEDEILEDISFDENKAYMLNLKKKTEEGIQNGSIKHDKGIEILTKLSIALNDKFSVSEKQDEQRVQVQVKYNHICEWTRKECFLQTKEYAIQNWGLADMEEIKKKYDLMPKRKENSDE